MQETGWVQIFPQGEEGKNSSLKEPEPLMRGPEPSACLELEFEQQRTRWFG